MDYSPSWITFTVVEIAQLTEELIRLIEDKFNFPKESCRNHIENYFKHLRNDLTVLIEYPYVDNVFRDSYYCYFSSKHQFYSRDCIRLSFFEGKIQLNSFRDSSFHEELNEKFLGICVLRPTYPQFFGKTLLSPRALKNQQFVSCIGRKTFSINGINLTTFSFPHASQDSEYLSCAETSIWSIMEYFGNKYVEYTPTLPSQIINILSDPALERMTPSHGLTIGQVSFTLKEFGFGSRIYIKETFNKEDDFRKILSFYIESGIPVIVGLQNEYMGHAVVFIGHEISKERDAEHLKPSFRLKETKASIINTADLQNRYVVIDDNFPPYQFCTFEAPAGYYNNNKVETLQIESFVVPLYPKIYLEADEGYRRSIEILDNILQPNDTDTITVRFFLTSSRSLKAKIASDPLADAVLKEVIISKPMPKFVWVAELSTPLLYSSDKANGLIILDSTGNGTREDLLLAVFQGKIYILTVDKRDYEIVDAGFDSFGIFRNNLKGAWSEWKA